MVKVEMRGSATFKGDLRGQITVLGEEFSGRGSESSVAQSVH